MTPETPEAATRPPPSVGEFYRGSVRAAERAMLDAAAQLEGLDEEIAVLRTKLRTLSKSNESETVQLMMRGMDMLAKLVSVRFRLSKKAEHEIADSLANLLRGLSVQLYPRVDDDA